MQIRYSGVLGKHSGGRVVGCRSAHLQFRRLELVSSMGRVASTFLEGSSAPPIVQTIGTPKQVQCHHHLQTLGITRPVGGFTYDRAGLARCQGSNSVCTLQMRSDPWASPSPSSTQSASKRRKVPRWQPQIVRSGRGGATSSAATLDNTRLVSHPVEVLSKG